MSAVRRILTSLTLLPRALLGGRKDRETEGTDGQKGLFRQPHHSIGSTLHF